jgi:nitronate monooxygenase
MFNCLMEKLKISVPIIQAPMAGVSTPALAAAVSNAGALGSISVGAMTVEVARQSINETKALTHCPFNVNVFCHETAAPNPARHSAWLKMLTPLFNELGATLPADLHEIYLSFNENEGMLNLLLELRPAVVSFHFGLPPKNMIQSLKEAGIILMASATNLREARLIEEANLDAIIAQGFEAGGHRGVFNLTERDDALGTFALTRLLARELKTPVIAAGGIIDGKGIHAALILGAQAVVMGTAFIACPESAADEAFRLALQSSRAESTMTTSVISGRPARGLPNKLTDFVSKVDCPPIPAYPFAYDATKALNLAAKTTGSSDFAVHWAGQGAPLARAIPAAELIEILKTELSNSFEATGGWL